MAIKKENISLSIILDREVNEILKDVANYEGTSVSKYVRSLILKDLRKLNKIE